MSAPRVASGSLMVCGTASNSGKSLLVAGLCRLLARQGVKVAPFKGQNMALNSLVTADGDEIGRAQGAQAAAASVEPEAAMNPVLLKPTSDRRSQVIVMGRPWRTLDAADFYAAKAELVSIVDQALDDLRHRFDVVICEGAGSPAEINLLAHDLVNLGLAGRAKVPAILVGDIDRGGVFAHLYGTTALLPDELRASLHAFVINKFRGDPALLGNATAVLCERTGLPTIGVVPWLQGVTIDAEDSLALAEMERLDTGDRAGDELDVAVVRLPRLSNFTDVDALALEPGVVVRWVRTANQLRGADLVILPGTKSTVADLAWLRERGFDRVIAELAAGPSPPCLLGLCGGYQMLGTTIADEDGVEQPGGGAVVGLGLLDVETRFLADKQTAQRRGRERGTDLPAAGYQVHHGRVTLGPSAHRWFALEGTDGEADDGARDDERAVYGTTLHGLFEGDEFRSGFLARVAARRGKDWLPSGVSFAAARVAQYDRVADACEAHLDLDALFAIVAAGALP